MELWQEIFCKASEYNEQQKVDFKSLLESACYIALDKIKKIIQNNSLKDDECFFKIEEIICILEDLGSNGGSRHDFG